MNGRHEHTNAQSAVDSARDLLEATMAFDAVYVCATFTDEEGITHTVQAGRGNWHAQNDMLQFVLKKRFKIAELEAIEQSGQNDE